jgi:hypothetical protein
LSSELRAFVGAHDPADIGHLVDRRVELQAAIIVGSRFEAVDLRPIPSTKYWANVIGAGLAREFLGISLPDVACGFRAFSRAFATEIVAHSRDQSFGFVLETLSLALRQSAAIGSVPTSVHYDATELAHTRRAEILDWLDSICRLVDEDITGKGFLVELRAQIRRFASFTIQINEGAICAHPIRDFDGYVFQAQAANLRARVLPPVLKLSSHTH